MAGGTSGRRRTTAGTTQSGSKAASAKSQKRNSVHATNQVSPEPPAKKRKVSHRSHVTTPGCALALGEGDTGQLGLGPDIMDRTKPAMVPNLPATVIQVCAGGMHTVCLTQEGKVYTFGCNDEGALGRNTSEEGSETEVGQVELGEKVVQVSAGDSHTAALTEDGKVFMWGTFRDANGRIGLVPGGAGHPTPVLVVKDQSVQKITSGSDHLAYLTEDGDVYTFGNAEQGQLGRVAECFSNRGGRKGVNLLLTPTKVCFKKRKQKFSDVWAGTYVTFVQAKDTGDIYAWGLNNYFQLGFPDMNNRFVPEKVKAFEGSKGWLEFSGGQHHTLALDSKGQVYSIGRKEYGRLGLGEGCEEATSPKLVPDLQKTTCVHVNCGAAVSFAVTQSGSIFAWGMGTSKQLAQREEDDLWSPTEMTGKQLENRNSLLVSAGGQHTVILAKDK